MKQFRSSPILGVQTITEELFRLDCLWKGSPPQAGQFFMVRPKRSSLFLARPFSAAGFTGETLSFLIARKGRGTEELAGLHTGEELLLTGPLGNGWEDRAPLFSGGIALVGGGIGIAPLLALIPRLREANVPVHLYAGFRKTLSGEACSALFDAALFDGKGGHKLVLAFEDGEAGFGGATPRRRGCAAAKRRAGGRLSPSFHYGRVTDFFDAASYSAVCACGPEAMLRAVSLRCAGTPCFVSLERRMACGTGACLGCAVETTRGNRRCCADGPIFSAEELLG